MDLTPYICLLARLVWVDRSDKNPEFYGEGKLFDCFIAVVPPVMSIKRKMTWTSCDGFIYPGEMTVPQQIHSGWRNKLDYQIINILREILGRIPNIPGAIYFKGKKGRGYFRPRRLWMEFPRIRWNKTTTHIARIAWYIPKSNFVSRKLEMSKMNLWSAFAVNSDQIFQEAARASKSNFLGIQSGDESGILEMDLYRVGQINNINCEKLYRCIKTGYKSHKQDALDN